MNMRSATSIWNTPGRIDELSECAANGMSAARIAAELSHRWRTTVTRSAIIGKCHRDGIQLAGKACYKSGPRGPRDGSPRKPAVKVVRGETTGDLAVVKAAKSTALRRPFNRSLKPPSAVQPRKPGPAHPVRVPPSNQAMMRPDSVRGQSVATEGKHHYRKNWPTAQIGHVPLMDLKPHHCRWPYDDPKTGKHLFCGYQKQDGSSYCPTHHTLSRNPTKAFKDSASAADYLAA